MTNTVEIKCLEKLKQNKSEFLLLNQYTNENHLPLLPGFQPMKTTSSGNSSKSSEGTGTEVGVAEAQLAQLQTSLYAGNTCDEFIMEGCIRCEEKDYP